MSNKHNRRERHVRARGERRDPPDLRRLARAFIALAQAQAEADAMATHDNSTRSEKASKRSPERKDAA